MIYFEVFLLFAPLGILFLAIDGKVKLKWLKVIYWICFSLVIGLITYSWLINASVIEDQLWFESSLLVGSSTVNIICDPLFVFVYLIVQTNLTKLSEILKGH